MQILKILKDLENNIDLDFMPCITRIIAYRQQKVFLASFNKTSVNQRQNLMEQINRIPQDQIDLFYHNFVNATHKKYSIIGNSKNIELNILLGFTIPNYIVESQLNAKQLQRIQAIGKDLVTNNKVALVIMCAGCSSRFDNQDKFLTPLKLKFNPALTLLDIIFMRLLFLLNKVQIPIIVTCNQNNFKSIQSFFRDRNYFGYDKVKFRFLQITCLPVLDLKGKYCINQKYKIIKRPFGTARTVIEILMDRTKNWLKLQGVKYIHFIGAQNLMQHPCDTLMLGLMKQRQKRICSKCVGTSSQWEKLPRYVTGKDQKIYLKIWSQLSGMPQPFLYSAYKFPIATNSLMIQFAYLEALIKDFTADIFLSQNYHILRKKQKIINPLTNRLISSECLTFQGDIRDLLTCSEDPLLLYSQRIKNYAPIFSKKDEYSIQSCVQFYEKEMQQQYKKEKNILVSSIKKQVKNG